MRFFFISSLFIFVALFFILPDQALAQGLVPCSGPECQACHFIQLGNNVLQWIIGVMATLCAIVIVIAGFKMLTAGGNTGKVSEAKSMMTNTIVGFIILLAAWLIVDTVMKTFVGDEIPGFGPWNKIECVPPPVQPAPPVPGTATTTPTPTTTPTACSIPPLTPITDTLALQMEGGTTLIWDNTDPMLRTCVNKFISQVGGSAVSAYRPPAYQNHLKEVHTRWCTQGLSTNTDAACSALKGEVQSEMSKHALSCSRPVATVSNHSAGKAVDINGIAHGTSPVLVAANASCLTWFGSGDPVHYTLRSGCTCN